MTAAVKFRKNYAGWMGVLNQQLIAPQFWEDIADEDINGTAVPGSDSLLEMPVNGPFLIAAASSEGIDYVPNPLWTADTGPYLDELRLRFYGSKDGVFTAFLNGEIDVTLNTTMADVKALQSVRPVHRSRAGRRQLDVRAPRLQPRVHRRRPGRPHGPPGPAHGHRQAAAHRRALPGRRPDPGRLRLAAVGVVGQ